MQRQTTCLVHLQTIPKWLQSGETFKKICDTWGTPDIDHFSNRLNLKVTVCASWKQDPGSSFINAFSKN